MGSRPGRHRYCRCGTHLAADNRGRQCASCERISRDKLLAAPEVPAEFWETNQLREAFVAQHLGRISRAYRTHPHHHPVYGPAGVPQSLLGHWLGVQQPQISRIESGPPVKHLDTLQHWARTLRIPSDLLWFDVPGGNRHLLPCPPEWQTSERGNATASSWGDTIPNQPSFESLLSAAPEEAVGFLTEQWHVLVRADNLFGPVHVLRLVHQQIELIELLLRGARDDIRASLLSLGARYAESAAWLHEDADDHRAAFWTSRALEWAHAGDDHQLIAWALFRRSQQMARHGHVARSIGLAQAAQNTRAPLPDQMRAAIIQQEACSLALDGDETACQRLLDDALRWAAPEPDLHGDARSGHGAFCTATYIELQRADCWRRLRRPRRAVATWEAALANLPAAYNRDRGYALAQFGNALIAANEPERAASMASEALGIARACGSGRTLHSIRALGDSLRPHASLPTVAWLLDGLAAAE